MIEADALRRKLDELLEIFAENERKLEQLQSLYEKNQARYNQMRLFLAEAKPRLTFADQLTVEVLLKG